jgi:Asp-tRNA(Asn)/Glu-tRNA(Gln) amidotransferase C subunit
MDKMNDRINNLAFLSELEDLKNDVEDFKKDFALLVQVVDNINKPMNNKNEVGHECK